MVKMTVDEAVATFDAVRAVYYEKDGDGLKERLLPFGVKYKLTKVKDALEKEFKSYDDARSELVKKYGEEKKREDGSSVFEVKPEEKENFFKDFNDVLLSEVEVSYPKLSESDCSKLEEKEIDLPEVYLKLLAKFVFE